MNFTTAALNISFVQITNITRNYQYIVPNTFGSENIRIISVVENVVHVRHLQF